MKTANRIKPLSGWKGHAVLYEVYPPMQDYDGAKHQYVVVSSVNAMFSGPETYIFPSDPNGNLLSWGEMPGSIQGSLSHADALREAGYIIT